MATKFWINKIHFATEPRRADLSKPIGKKNNTLTNSQVEVDLRGMPSNYKAHIASGDVVYIAVNGSYEFANGEKRNSLRIVAKGVVDRIDYRNDKPIAVFVQGSFEHMTAPMINGLDEKILLKDCVGYKRNLQSPYWSITDSVANYIDKCIFSAVKSI